MRWFCALLMTLGRIGMLAYGQGGGGDSTGKLREVAHAYYLWRNENDPVGSSDRGLHSWDDRLGDFSEKAIAARRKHVAEVLAQVKGMRTDSWAKEDKIDWVLFSAELERVAFFDRVLRREQSDPQTYTAECANGIFSLLKKEYLPGRTRACRTRTGGAGRMRPKRRSGTLPYTAQQKAWRP